MVRNQPERDEVLNPCKKLCKELHQKGYILKWRRLDALDYYHEDGDPDLEIWISNNNILIILMVECKRPDGGSLSKSQIDYKNRYTKFKNVIFVEIRNYMELNKIIINIADNRFFDDAQFKDMQDWSM